MGLKSFKQRRLQSLLLRPSNPVGISPLFQQFHPLSTKLASSSSSSDIHSTSKTEAKLTHQEITKINLLIPRLCLSGHLTTAIHLTTTALLTNPPPKSLSFSFLVYSLTSQPDMTKSMSLLTILRHTPQAHHPHLSSIATTLITSYIRKKRPKEALKVYHWMLRPGCPCGVEKVAYGVLINGFCECGLVIEGLRVLRDMVNVGFVAGAGLRERVYRSLLREARVKDAVELNEGLGSCCGEDANGDSMRKVVALLNSVIDSWTE